MTIEQINQRLAELRTEQNRAEFPTPAWDSLSRQIYRLLIARQALEEVQSS